MCKFCPTLPIRGLLWLAICILAPTWAPAEEFSFDGGSGCSDPPIFGQFFTFSANSSGGFCTGFGNHSGRNFDSLQFVTTIPNVSPTLNCSHEPYFLFCDFFEDTAANTLTILLHGLDRTHTGIPVAPPCPIDFFCPQPPDNFFINLNNVVCDPSGLCAPPHDTNGRGDWLTNGVPVSFSVTANAPEPATWVLMLVGAGALLARVRLMRKKPRRAV